MIQGLGIRSFKAFDGGPRKPDEMIRFQPFTMLVGPNGAGKSTVLQAIEILGQLASGTIGEMLETHHWEYADLQHLQSRRQNISLTVHLVLPRSPSPIVWRIELGGPGRPRIETEIIATVQGEKRNDVVLRMGRHVKRISESTGHEETTVRTLPASWLSTVDPRDVDDYPTLVALKYWASGIRAHYFLDPAMLRSPSAPSRTATDQLGPHGEDLAAVLGRLKRRPKDFARLVERVTAHYPRLVDIRPRKTKYGWTHLEITEKWNGAEATFNARQVSEGLLRMIAVAALHEMEEAPSVLLLDEIENGLHPRLLGGFVSMLEELTKGGRTQVIAATHSPIALNYVSSPESVLLMTRNDNGGITVTPMSQAKSFDKLREHFDLGELWYNVGEERLVPSPAGKKR